MSTNITDVIFAPYFTKDREFSQHDSSNNGRGGCKPNDFSLIAPWYESVKRNNVRAVIFHNELSDQFVEKYSTENISFYMWDRYNRPSYNDERFYAYESYLINHSEIERVMCTDLFDVVVQNNPFGFMDLHPGENNLFVGSEAITRSNAVWMRNKCMEMHYPCSRENFSESYILFNAGIFGGSKNLVMSLIHKIIVEFSCKTGMQFNANMPVFNRCIETMVNDREMNIITGYPLHNVFRSNVANSSVYIKHK